MILTVRQISSLPKVQLGSELDYPEINSVELLQGERFSYQIAYRANDARMMDFAVEGELKPYIRLYQVNQSPFDTPVTEAVGLTDPDFISRTPGLMPDLLTPLNEGFGNTTANLFASAVRIELKLPRDIKPGA